MARIICLRSFRPLGVAVLLLILLAAAMVFPLSRELTAQAAAGLPLQGRTVAVDGGHGGYDPGAIGVSGAQEKDINLQLSQELAAELTRRGATVIETRQKDESLGDSKRADLDARAAIVTGGQAEIFLSMQCNALANSACRGAQVFFYPGSAEGERLARALQSALRETLGNNDREALSADTIYLLRVLDMPAVVVEAGFLSNAEEEALLLDAAYRSRVVQAVADGICQYFHTEAPVTTTEEDWQELPPTALKEGENAARTN